MKNSYKRILAFFLAVIISVGAMPVDILAQEVGELIESLEQNDSSDTSGNADAEGSTEADSCDHLQTTIEVQEPTCKENGYRQTVCSLCSEIISKTELEKSTDHTPSEAVIIEPGCKLPGSETVYCSVCNEKLSETILPITEHTPGKDADCTNDQICAVCRTVLSPAIGHLPNSEGRCMYCSAKSVLTDGIKYTLNEEDGTATVTGYTGGSKEIYITNTIEGCTVTAISAAAFADADDITSVTIPGTITNIEENAFSGCSSLSLVIFNSTEEQWNSVNIASGNEPFLNCEKLFFLRFESNGAMAEVRDDVIASDADFICTVSDPESIDIKSPAGFETENSAVYSISFEKDGEMIAPMFPFTLSIPLPETLSGEKCKVFHIDENGNADGINSYYENGYLRFATSLSGNFAIMSIAYSICDVNADGIISAKDLNLINKALAGILPFTPESLAFFAADVDADGILTAKDLNKAYRIVSGGESMPAVCVHYERTVPGYAATCEESGLTDGVVCEKCHKILTAQAEIPPLGHYSVITEHIEPTCTDNGYIKRICLVCELEYAAEILYSKGHSFSEGEVMRNATCTEEGIIQSTCSECGKTNSTLTDKIAHSYELTSENDDGTSTYTCFACGFTTVTSGAPDGTSTERFENKCPADYTFEIVSENDEEYIRENLKIIDLRYKDTENEADGYVSYELTDMGDTVKVSPTQGYTEGNSYVATVSGDIQFADNSSTELLFSIEREETSEIDINDDVVFITLPDEGSAERDKYIVDTESDENYIYATIPSGSGYDHVTVGDIVCIGEYTSEEHFVNTPGLYANFGKVDQKLNASGDSFTLVLSCPALEEIYDYMDVHYNKYAIIEDEETLEAIEDQVEQSLYASEYMNEYLTSSILTAKVYAAENSLEIEEHDINVALGKLNLQFESKNIENGIYVSAYGSFDIITKDKDNYTYTLKFFMKASFKATIETSADAAVTWWGRVDKLECFVTTTTVTSFETGVTIELDLELFKSNNPDALIMTPSGIYHTKECVRVSDIAADSYTSITAKEAEEYYDKKNGFITNECPACRPFTSYMNNNFYVSNTDTKTVHKFVCCSLDRFQGNDNLISTNIPRSYTYCESCNPGIGSGISFDEYMYEKLKAVSWSKIYDTVTAYTNKKENQGKVTKEIPVKIIPVYFGAVFEVLVELEVSMELRIEGTFSYEYTQTCINVSGVYLNDDGDLETVSIKDSFAETSKFKVMGKLEFLVGFQAEVKVTFHGCNKFLYISFSIRVGPYFDLYGMFAMDIDSEDKSLSYSYGTVFLEIGFYIDANINFKAFIFDCSLSLIGGTKKLPIIRVGHNIGYYNYIDSPEFLDVTGSKIDLNGYDFNIQSFNVTDPEEVGIDQLDLRGKYGEYTVDITVLDENGEEPNYAYENGGVIRLKSNAPCDLTLTVKISVDDVDPPIESINDLLNVIFRKNRVKYTLEDYIFKVHFTYHRVGGWQITTPPTCTEEGVETKFYICDCRDENGDPLEFIQRSVPALGHKKALIKAIKMTCTTDGYTSGWGCARCDYIFKAPELIPARGHSYADPFTCHDRPCLYSDCSHIEPTSTPHNFTEWMTIPTGSCGGVEFEMRSCVDCFFSESTLPPDSATHGCKYKTAVEKHPTCTEAGYYEFVCENCGETIEKTVPAIGHKWKSGYNSVYHYKECQNQNCTATKDQIKHSYKYECSSKCEKCAYERGSAHIWDNEYVPYGTGHRQKCSICKSHSPIEEHIGGIPTCTEKGSCILCDESYIDATGHDYSLAVPSEEYLATEATCTQSATYYYLCADCNEVGSTTYSHGDKTEHPWKDTYTPGVECHWIGCSVCSATKGKDVHTGGTASCLERAICSVCNSPYGDTNSHIYDNDCDIECNECGHIRTAPHNWSAGYITGETEHWKLCLDCSAETDRASHNYSGACGSECTSGCGTTRVPPHSWKDVLEKDEKSHWTECALCHEKKDAADHIYDSVCDSDCNICSYVRIAPHNLPEEYIVTESEHWKTCADCSLDIGRDAHSGGSATCQSPAICSLCFESYGSATDHRYDEPCGSECTFDCGTTRVPPHSWRVVLEKDETSHWAECDICHEKKTISNHVYDSNCDSSCDICSYERIAPHNLPEEYTVSASEHWKTCADCSLDFERKAHSGGSATCQSPAICSVCSESYGSAADHKYDEPCGSECTFDCGTTRVPPHSWKEQLENDESSHWAECELCHEKKDIAGHVYDSNCDSSCDICSYIRIAPHNPNGIYINDDESHWITCLDCNEKADLNLHDGIATCTAYATCSVCNVTYGELADHTYTNACDTTCNACGHEREITHSPDIAVAVDDKYHSSECIVCHETITGEHTGGEATCDTSGACSECGHKYIAPTGHDFSVKNDEHRAADATCSDPESFYLVCSVCGEAGEDIYYKGAPLGHNWIIPDKDEYNHWYRCDRDGCSSTNYYEPHYGGEATCHKTGVCTDPDCRMEYLPKLEHVPEKIIDAKYLAKQASCTEKATYYYVCGLCGDNLSETYSYGELADHIPKDSRTSNTTHHWYKCANDDCKVRLHEEEHYGGIPGCTKAGTCTACRRSYISATGHTKVEIVHEDYFRKEATCTEAESYYYFCSACEKTLSEYFTVGDPLPHDWDEEDYKSDAENHWFKCKNCSAKGYMEAHTFGEYQTVTPATCTEEGEEKKTCSVCSYEESRPIPALGHTISDSYSTLTEGPTVTPSGESIYVHKIVQKCTRFDECGHYVQTGEVVEHAHKETTLLPGANATCTESGLTAGLICGVKGCDHVYVEQEIIPATGHAEGETVTTEATCIRDGATVVLCKNCSAEISNTVIPALGHDYVDGTCTRCGDVDKVQNGTTGSCFWRLEGTVLIIYGSGAMEDYTSISLAPWGTDITEVIIENGVTYIGGSSFSNCQSLTGITIPDSVTRIGYNAFNGCNKLEYISLPDNLIKIELGTFQNCSSLVSITIPDSVTSIGTNAFRNCTSLVSISIPDGVTSIGGSAFQNCPSLTDVTIPKSVTKLDTFAFYSCFAITDVWYEGTADDRAEITIDSYNTDITGAAWHYESCIKNPGEEKVHSYTDDSDADCNFCGAVREVEAAYDATGTTGECYWGLKGTTLIIWGNGAMANYTSSSAAPWGKAITEVIIEEGVISIGDRAFYDCTSLAIITISNGVTSIGGSAFSGCANLTSITIPDSVTSINGHAFNGCKGITSITIPDSVTSIGMYAFYDCSSLSDIIIPVGITSIGSYIFGNCSRLTSINIPNGVTSIGRGAFFSCTNLKSITIPDGVKSIGDGAFNACRCLASITIPDSITAIGGHAFHGCSSLTSITIPDSITTINDYTFNGCSKLTSITIPNSVTSIGKYAFQNCSKLTDVWYEGTADDRAEITIDSYNTDITGAAWHYESCIKNPGEEKVHSYADDSDTDCDFCGAVREVEQTSGITGECTWSLDGTVLTISGNGAMADYTFEDTLPWRNGITEVIIEDGVTSIGSYAFKNCFGLTSISVADSVTSIGDYAFFWCECLESIIFPASLESIGREAFSSCSALSSVTLPKGVTTIADYAFDGCSSLANVWYEGTEEDLANVTVSDGNSSFTGAAWHYSSCMKNPGEEKVHSYADDSDTDCDFCGAVREVEAVYDATGTTGDCYWGLKGTTLTIWGNGAMGNYTSSFDVPWGTDITKVIIEDGVTSIGNHAFSDCSSLTSISLPESLTSIGDYAFCSCSNLASISLPESLTSIGNYAFFNCSDLASIAFPDGITNIGIGAFSSCQKLESVSFLNCKSLTKIRGSSICDCENLTSIILPLTITTIWPYAFFGCPNLTDVWYEGSEADRAQINYAYEFCRDPLKDVNWHYNFCEKSTSEDKVHSYSSDSDTDCDNCGYIRETATEYDAEGTTGDCYWKLKGTVLTIYGNGAMADYTRRQKAPWYSYEITQIIIENGVTHVSDRTFFYNDKIELITSVYLPASLTSIGTDAFNGCINLKRIDFPAGLTDIGESAFANCSGLVNIYFPKSLVTIGEYAFENCENLVNVSMYKGITKIGTDAFTGTSLTDVWCEGNENDHIIIFTNSEITYHYDSCMMFPWATETIGGGGHYYTTVSGNECINCGAVREVECSHTPGDEATCTTAQTCSTCGKVLAEALGHTPGAAATCTTAQVCTVCSTVITNALGHTEGQTVTTVATCTEDGVAVVLCSRCSAEISRTLIPALGHNFVNGTCTRCGESDYDATGTTGDCYWKLKGTTLTIYGNGAMGDYTYKSASPWSTDITEIIIEDGVTSIGTYAFYNCSSLTSVTIPDSVTNINGYAFRSCSSLESITIPDGVTRINDYTFDYCKSLTSITIPDGVNAIGNNAFNGCSSLTSIAIPDSVVSLGNYTFYNCSSLSGIAIPDSVTSIGNFTFCGCSQLISITIPDSIASIGNSAFRDCTGLVNITIPDSVTSIGNCAFYGCSRLIGITIPDSITSINDYTFDFCSRLTNITLPNSVTSIGYEAFHLCSNLTDVWYEGTEEDRTAIAINSYNTPLTGAIWHYESCMKNPGAEKVHSYTDDSDADCDLCGYERAVTG